MKCANTAAQRVRAALPTPRSYAACGEVHPELGAAVDDAYALHQSLCSEMPELLALDEDAQLARVQGDFINFYPEDAINPFVALAGRGPWVATLKGAVVHDSGGYGMLGFGHTPKAIIDALSRPQVMANVMTPSCQPACVSRARSNAKSATRVAARCSKHFFCLNSGSESVSLACRIADVNAKLMTAASAPATPAFATINKRCRRL